MNAKGITSGEDGDLLRVGPDFIGMIKVAKAEDDYRRSFVSRVINEIKAQRNDYNLPRHFSVDLGLLQEDFTPEVFEQKHYAAELKLWEHLKLIQNLLMRDRCEIVDEESNISFEIVFAEFDAESDVLMAYLEKREDQLSKGLILIEVDPDKGFYREGKNKDLYPINSTGKGKLRYNLILALKNKGKLTAGKLAKEAGYKDSHKISSDSKDINNQFKKKCRLSDDVIKFDGGLYSINPKIKIVAKK